MDQQGGLDGNSSGTRNSFLSTGMDTNRETSARKQGKGVLDFIMQSVKDHLEGKIAPRTHRRSDEGPIRTPGSSCAGRGRGSSAQAALSYASDAALVSKPRHGAPQALGGQANLA